MAGYNSGLNGILYVTKERFDSEAMTKQPMTLYVVADANSFTLYLGNIPLQSNGAASAYFPFGTKTRTYALASGFAGDLERPEEVKEE